MIWVDGDSCPRSILNIILRAVKRGAWKMTVVADRDLKGMEGKNLRFIRVPHGEGTVDTVILEGAVKGDLAVTRDFHLAAKLCAAAVTVLNDRGRVWTHSEAMARSREADLMRALRGSGVTAEKPRRHGPRQARTFAAALDRELKTS